MADEFLCQASKADFIRSFKREKKAAERTKQRFSASKTLGGFSLPQKAMCDNPRSSSARGSLATRPTFFVINDHREYGSYVGQHGLVMENGLPSKVS